MTHKIEDANNRRKRLQQQGKDSTNALDRDNSPADVDCQTECVLTHSKGQLDCPLRPMYKHLYRTFVDCLSRLWRKSSAGLVLITTTTVV